MPASPTVPRGSVLVQSSNEPEHSCSSTCSSEEEESPTLIEEAELQSSERSAQTPSRADNLATDEMISPVPKSPEVNSEQTRAILFISPPRRRNIIRPIDDESFSNDDGEEMIGNPFEIDSPPPVGVPRIGRVSCGVSTMQLPEDSPVPPADVRKIGRELFGLRCDCDDAELTNDARIVDGGDMFKNSLEYDEAPPERVPQSPKTSPSNLHAEYYALG